MTTTIELRASDVRPGDVLLNGQKVIVASPLKTGKIHILTTAGACRAIDLDKAFVLTVTREVAA